MFEIFFRWLYWFPYRFLIQATPLRVGYFFAPSIGLFVDIIHIKKRNKLNEGIRFLGYGEDMVRIIRRDVFKNLVVNGMEVFHFQRLNKKRISDMISYEGLENLNTALKRERGVILLHAHFGNEELLMPALGYLGYRVNQVASRWNKTNESDTGIPRLLNWVDGYAYKKKIGYREGLPVNFIYVDRYLRGIYRVLKNNEILLLTSDGREGNDWLEVKLCGKTALFSPGPMRIAFRSNATVLPIFIVREEDKTHRIIIHKPLELNRTGNRDTDILDNTQSFADILSNYIIKYPDHYFKVFLIDKPLFKKEKNDNDNINISVS